MSRRAGISAKALFKTRPLLCFPLERMISYGARWFCPLRSGFDASRGVRRTSSLQSIRDGRSQQPSAAGPLHRISQQRTQDGRQRIDNLKSHLPSASEKTIP